MKELLNFFIAKFKIYFILHALKCVKALALCGIVVSLITVILGFMTNNYSIAVINCIYCGINTVCLILLRMMRDC